MELDLDQWHRYTVPLFKKHLSIISITISIISKPSICVSGLSATCPAFPFPSGLLWFFLLAVRAERRWRGTAHPTPTACAPRRRPPGPRRRVGLLIQPQCPSVSGTQTLLCRQSICCLGEPLHRSSHSRSIN